MECKKTLNRKTGEYRWDLKVDYYERCYLSRALWHAIKYEKMMEYSDSDIKHLKQLLQVICPDDEEEE